MWALVSPACVPECCDEGGVSLLVQNLTRHRALAWQAIYNAGLGDIPTNLPIDLRYKLI